MSNSPEDLTPEDKELLDRIFEGQPHEVVIGKAVPSSADIAIYYAQLDEMRAARLSAEASPWDLDSPLHI